MDLKKDFDRLLIPLYFPDLDNLFLLLAIDLRAAKSRHIFIVNSRTTVSSHDFLKVFDSIRALLSVIVPKANKNKTEWLS